MATVRDATVDLLRRHGLTTLFANPGSTEIAFLTGLPDDFTFVLGLHEGTVVGMASGYALARERPALVNLHTTAGLGNAVGALATALVNRAPLVVLVGQQDRRHMALEPFLTGRLRGLAGDYPVWTHEPPRAQDVPAAIARAYHEAVTGRGPALVIVPSGDWSQSMDGVAEIAAPALIRRASTVDQSAVQEVAELLRAARSPALVVGAGAASLPAWEALTALAERLNSPVFQESFGARPGFPQDHPRFARHLPADRTRLRKILAPHDAVLAVGAPVFRQSLFEPGPLAEEGTRLALITDDAAEAHRAPVEVAVLGPVAAAVQALNTHLGPAPALSPPSRALRAAPPPPVPATGAPLRPPYVLGELAARLPHDVILVEESPSSRPNLEVLIPARTPLGFVSAANGGLGFGLPAALGLRLAAPDRPVVGIIGDGSAMYAIQALWSAAHYRIGALILVMANGRYAVMDRHAERHEGKVPWPGFEELSTAALARAMGCPSRVITTPDELRSALDEVIPTLATRQDPLLLEVTIQPDPTFTP